MALLWEVSALPQAYKEKQGAKKQITPYRTEKASVTTEVTLIPSEMAYTGGTGFEVGGKMENKESRKRRQVKGA